MRIYLSKAERIAAITVLSMSAGVAAAGVALLRRHARYLAKRAAATFQDDELDPLVWPEGAVWEKAAGEDEGAAGTGSADQDEHSGSGTHAAFTDPVPEG